MKARTLLLAVCLMGTREVNATNQVDIITSDLPGLVRLSTNLMEFAEAALSANDAKKADIIKLIAWSVKCSDVTRPPHLGEEVIVLVHWNQEATTGRWCLAHVMRSNSSPDRSWGRWTSQPIFPTRLMYDSEPSDAEIARFIKATSFGYNEHDLDVYVLRVVSYRDAEPILRTLEEGISETEKAERRAKLLSVFMHPRPQLKEGTQ